MNRPTLRQRANEVEAGRVDLGDEVDAACRRRVEAWDAYRRFDGDGARGQAAALEAYRRHGGNLGPLAGVPVSVKDLYGVRGFRTHAGTPIALPVSFSREGPVVRRLRRAGALVVGKTRTVALAFGALGTNAPTRTPANPSDPARVPGGSSSGAAVSLREGSARLALGTDTAGSIRIPASFCGVVGFMPAPGRWSTDGIVPLSPTLDAPGVMARSIDDIRFAFEVIEGSETARVDEVDPSRIVLSVAEHPFLASVASEVGEVFDEALRRFARSGARIVRRRSPGAQAALRLFDEGSVTACEAEAFVRHRAPFLRAHLGERVARAVAEGGELDGVTYLRRRRRIDALRRRAPRELDGGVVWAVPTTPDVAPRLVDVDDAEGYAREDRRALHHACVANLLGFTAMSLPAGRDARGLPVGLMLMAPAGHERRLLAAGRTLERVLPRGGPAE